MLKVSCDFRDCADLKYSTNRHFLLPKTTGNAIEIQLCAILPLWFPLVS
jgi:hypothetical protein